jgi:hypothetical protein
MGGGTLDPNNKYGLTQALLDRIKNFGLYGQATPPVYQSQQVAPPYIGGNTGYPVNGFGQASGTGLSSYQTATSAPSSTFQVASPWGMTGGKGPQTQAGGYQSNPVGRGKGFQSGGAVKGINPERILEVARRVVKDGGGGAFIPHGDPQRDANLSAFLEGNHPDVPHVVYHGTDQDFNEFDNGKIATKTDHGYLGHGFYFDESPIVASVYGRKGNVKPVHLSMKNPFQLKYKIENGKEVDREKLIRSHLGLPPEASPMDITNEVKSRGHDGITYDGVFGNKEIVAFDPRQIKSATGNDGTFDPTNPDIRRAAGGEVDDPSQIHGIHVTTRRPGFRDGGAPNDEGFDAYHGTPHTFPAERLVQHPDGTQEHIVGGPDQLPDVPEGATVLKDYPLGRFRDEGIGTGEGNQSYGYGHYTAGHEGTAKTYRNALSGEPVTSEGYSPFYESPLKNNKAVQYLAKISLQQALDKKLSGDAAIEDAVHDLNRNAAFSERRDIKQRYYDAANNLLSLRGKNWSINPGHMLHLRVNANPNHFLDWDKPIENQHPDVMNKIMNTAHQRAQWESKRKNAEASLRPLSNGADSFDEFWDEINKPDENKNNYENVLQGYFDNQSADLLTGIRDDKLPLMTGEDIYKYISRKSHKDAASYLKSLGIPGIRYLDQQSRGRGDYGTHNYVVFDPNKIDIKRRYARGGTVPQGGNMDIVNKALQLARMHDKLGFAKGGAPANPEKTALKERLLSETMRHISDIRQGIASPNAESQPNSVQFDEQNPKRLIFSGREGRNRARINVPAHMWTGAVHNTGALLPGMHTRNAARAKVYGAEKRDPLSLGKVEEVHKSILNQHFALPVEEQIKREKEATARLREAMHLPNTGDTLDKSEKLDTVNHERDAYGRGFVAFGSKGIAGHALYTSGHGPDSEFHIVNTCPGQSSGCGGGKDEHDTYDTTKGACFAPIAESQYPGAAIKRATHIQAKLDPAMTGDWILAHTGALRRVSNNADKKRKITLFRPNVVDESDRSSRHVIAGLNKQRAAQGLPGIIANSYGKTSEIHDPENGYFVTYSNAGPKVRPALTPTPGRNQSEPEYNQISENIKRDASRIRQTANREDNKTGMKMLDANLARLPLKNSYMVTTVKRYSPLDKAMQQHFTHAKYWSEIKPTDLDVSEGHYDGEGNETTPDKAHYGYKVIQGDDGERYVSGYQKQHFLHPRLVKVGKNKDGSDHMVPTDSRFMDENFLPPVEQRYKTPSGKVAGAILLTTPTESTSTMRHHTQFNHFVDWPEIEHAQANNGEYEIDAPEKQLAAAGREYVPPRKQIEAEQYAPQKTEMGYATGGAVGDMDDEEDDTDGIFGFPEQNGHAQYHLAHRAENWPDDALANSHNMIQKHMPDLGNNVIHRALSVIRHASQGAK